MNLSLTFSLTIRLVTLNLQRNTCRQGMWPVALATHPQAVRHLATLKTELQVSEELSGEGSSFLRPSRRVIQTVETRMTAAPSQVH